MTPFLHLVAIVVYLDARHVDPKAAASILLPFGTEHRGQVVMLLARSAGDATAMTCGMFDLLNVTFEPDGRYRWHYDNPEVVAEPVELPCEHGCIFALDTDTILRAFGAIPDHETV